MATAHGSEKTIWYDQPLSLRGNGAAGSSTQDAPQKVKLGRLDPLPEDYGVGHIVADLVESHPDKLMEDRTRHEVTKALEEALDDHRIAGVREIVIIEGWKTNKLKRPVYCKAEAYLTSAKSSYKASEQLTADFPQLEDLGGSIIFYVALNAKKQAAVKNIPAENDSDSDNAIHRKAAATISRHTSSAGGSIRSGLKSFAGSIRGKKKSED